MARSEKKQTPAPGVETPRWDPTKPQRRLAYLFILPWILGFLLLSVYPIVSSFYLSFTKYNLAKAPEWVGFKNYVKIFTKDRDFVKSVVNSVYLLLIGLPIQLALSILLAVLLSRSIRGRGFFRTAWYIPTLVSPAASALVWMWMLNPEYGLVNGFLRTMGLPGPLWFHSAEWAKPAIILMGCWTVGTTMVVYLSGIGEIPQDYYEAMEIDGGGGWKQFWYITWPLMSNITLFQLINGIIASFNSFTATYVISTANRKSGMSLGGYKNSLLFYAVNIYQKSFSDLKFGYASALAVISFIFVMLLTLCIFKLTHNWVHYDE